MRDFLLGAGFGALAGIALVLVILLLAAIYVYSALALISIFRKTKVGPRWLAWIPIGNILPLLKIAKLQWQWIFALLLVCIPKIGGPLVGLGAIYLWWKVCKARHKPEWLSVLMLVPGVNFVVMGYLAWSK